MQVKKQDLKDKVIEQMKQDIKSGDWTAIDELLNFVTVENLICFLREVECEQLHKAYENGTLSIED